MAGRETRVRAALESPDEIRQSRTDPEVLLFYKGRGAQALDLRAGQAHQRRSIPGHSLSDRRDQRRRQNMAELKVFYDREGKTLTVWFTDRSQEYVCEETGDEVVLMKDRDGRVIGFEKLNFSVPDSDSLRVPLETAPA